MIFCDNCGSHIVNGAKFCQHCGHAVSESAYSSNEKRQQEFSGKVYKCPNCGEILKSFATNCPACGFELRGTKVVSAVREFSLKLEAIEAKREYEKPTGILSKIDTTQHISKTDEQKISLIKSFSVPNTKEDILEFMILSTSNMDTSVYGSTDTPTASAKAIANAWDAKIRQVYEKAKNSYGMDTDFQRIEQLYNNYTIDLNNQKKKRILKWILLISWIPLMFVILIVSLSISSPKKDAAEETRLGTIVSDIEVALEQKDYKLALRNAESMEYNGFDDERDRWWKIKKESLIDEIIDKAAENGVYLEHSPITIEKNNDDIDSGGFIDGFKEEVQPGIDNLKESINEFKRNMENEKNTDSNDNSKNQHEGD